jgi:hypothetical protein
MMDRTPAERNSCGLGRREKNRLADHFLQPAIIEIENKEARLLSAGLFCLKFRNGNPLLAIPSEVGRNALILMEGAVTH